MAIGTQRLWWMLKGVPGDDAINGSKLGNEFYMSVKC